MATTDKVILFLGRTFSSHHNDDTLLKTEFPPEFDWFAELSVLVDVGDWDIHTDYTGEQIALPHKKPRQSKRHCAGLWNFSLIKE